jgi:peptide/nickel transport system permease protein
MRTSLATLSRIPTAWISGGVIAVLVLAGLAGPAVLSLQSPLAISMDILEAPSSAYLLGTDELGRSVLSQIILGVRVSLTIGLLSALSASIGGAFVGGVAGYFGGALDLLLMRVAEMFQVMPTFILAAMIVAILGAGEMRIILVIALLSWPQTARLIRGDVLKLKQMDFVSAVRCLGVGEFRILLREVVPNAIGPVIAFGTLTVAQAILLEASLSYFGLSSPEVVSWGRMLASGQRFLYQAWWLSVFPGLAIFMTVIAFNVFGDCVRDALDPRLVRH